METYHYILILSILFIGYLIYRGRKKKKQNKKYDLQPFEYRPGSMEADILHHINKFRKVAGVKPLVGDRYTNILAGVRVKEMIEARIENGIIDHKGFGKQSLKLIELDADNTGENISFGQGTALGVVKGWFNKKTKGKHKHRRNMLNPKYDWVGIYVEEFDGRNYFCAFFGGDDNIN